MSLCSTLEFAATPTQKAIKRKASEELLPELPKLKAEDEDFKPASGFTIQPHTSDWTKLKVRLPCHCIKPSEADLSERFIGLKHNALIADIEEQTQ